MNTDPKINLKTKRDKVKLNQKAKKLKKYNPSKVVKSKPKHKNDL